MRRQKQCCLFPFAQTLRLGRFQQQNRHRRESRAGNRARKNHSLLLK